MNLNEIKINKRNILIILISLLIGAIGYLSSMYFLFNTRGITDNYESIIYVLNWVGIAIMLYTYVSWYILTKEWFCPYNIFMIFFFIFNYGQCIMWAFNIHIPGEIGARQIYYGHWIPTIEDIIRAQVFTCICMFMFHVGAILCYKPSTRKKCIELESKKKKYNVDSINRAMFYIGILMGIITIPMTIYRAYTFLSVALKYGYKALYYSNHISQGGMMMIIEIFFFPSIVCLLIGGRYKINIRYMVYSIFGTYMLLNIMAGDRGSWLYKLIILIWLHNKYVKKISLKQAIRLGVAGIVGLYLLNIIISFRNIGLSNIQFKDIIEAVSLESSPIVDSFFEMGGTMAVITTLLRDGVGIWTYGNTYLATILGSISTRVLSLLGIEFILIDNWFSQDYLGVSWGAGFSMIGEAFLNGGGYFTPIILVVLGFMIGSVIYVDSRVEPIKHPMRYFFVSTSLQTLIGFSRGSSYLYLKTWLYGTVGVCIMIILLQHLFQKKYNSLKL